MIDLICDLYGLIRYELFLFCDLIVVVVVVIESMLLIFLSKECGGSAPRYISSTLHQHSHQILAVNYIYTNILTLNHSTDILDLRGRSSTEF